MILDTNELQIVIDKLSSNLDKYNLEHLSYYNLIGSSTSIWNDKKSEQMMKEVEKQKINISLFIDSLQEYINSLKLLINELSFIKGKIKIDLQSIDNLTKELNLIIDNLEKIIKIYERINVTSDLLTRELNEFKTIHSSALELKEFIDKLFTTVNDINITMQSKLTNLNIPIIKEEELV